MTHLVKGEEALRRLPPRYKPAHNWCPTVAALGWALALCFGIAWAVAMGAAATWGGWFVGGMW
jgi:hypothetical protein